MSRLVFLACCAWVGAFVAARSLQLARRTGRQLHARLEAQAPPRAVLRVEAGIGLGLLTYSAHALWLLLDPEGWRALPAFALDPGWAQPLAAALHLAAAVLLTAANLNMGDSWVMGVSDERLPLVQHGLYAHVRHPIYTAMFGYMLAGVLFMPTYLQAATCLLGCWSLCIEAALEEDHWLRLEPEAYGALMRRTGAFLPWKWALAKLLGR